MNAFQRTTLKWLGLSYLVDAANWRERFRRPLEPLTVNTISKEINEYDWVQLLSDSRKLYCNQGPMKGVIDQKAVYSIGRAWNPKFTGTDLAWGAQAEQWLREEWYPMADARGSMYDFKTDLYLSSVCTDRDGEIFIHLTEADTGWPQIQLIPAHMIGQRDRSDDTVDSGPYKGLSISQGVVTNNVGRPVAYHMLGPTPDADEYVSARDLIQVYDPEWPDQLRGFPMFMHALLDLKDLRQIQGYEKIAAEMMASYGILEWNEQGAPDMDPASILRSGVNNGQFAMPDVAVQSVAGGGNAKFFRSNSGSKLEGLKNDRPGDAVENFMDRLIRNACVGAGWPFELTWDASKLGGANVRLLIAKAMRAVEDRQDLIRPVAKRVVGYAVAKAIKQGVLAGSDEWYKWSFTMPARMTADYGREAAADLADLEAGVTELGDILGEEGKDLDEFIARRKRTNEKLVAAGLPPIATVEPAAPALTTKPIKE